MAVYDDQKERDSTGDLNKVTGIDEKAEAKMQQAAQVGAKKDLADRENGLYNPNDSGDKGSKDSEAKGAGAAATSLASKLSGKGEAESGGGISNLINTIKKRRQQVAVGVGAASAVIGLVTALFSLSSGPFQFIHAGQLLQGFHFATMDDFGDDRTSKLLIYALAGRAAKGRLGVVSNTYADKWESRLNNDSGLKSAYSPTTQRFIGYQVIDRNKAAEFLKDMDSAGVPRTNDLPSKGIDGNVIDPAKGEFVDLRDDKFKGRREVMRVATKSIGLNKISSTLGTRMLMKRGGVNFHPLKNIVRSKNDVIAGKWEERQRIAKAAEIETGSSTPGAESPFKAKRQEILTKLRSVVQTIKTPIGIAIAVCGIKSFNESIDLANLESQQQRMRMGMSRVTIASQVMSNRDINLEILGAFAGEFFDEETGSSWNEDPGIQMESGQPVTGRDYNADNKPGSKERPLVLRAVDSIPTGFTVLGANLDVCNAIESATQLPGIEQALGLMDAATTRALLAIGIDIDALYAKAVAYFAEGGINLLAEGAERAGLENGGVRMAANNQFLASGAKELTATEAAEVKKDGVEYREASFANASVYDKYFNLYSPQSVMAKVASSVPMSQSQWVASITNMPSKIAHATMNTFGFSKKVSAQNPATYDYGFPLFGFTKAERNNPAYLDPYANATAIIDSGQLDYLNAEYGQLCYNMTITADGTLNYGETTDFTKIPSNKCVYDTSPTKCDGVADREACIVAANQELVSYRFFRADMITVLGLACYEGDETACKELFGGTGVAPSPTGGSGSNAIIGDPYTETVSVPCDPRTKELGLADGYNEGNIIKLRLCAVSNMPSNGQSDNPGGLYSTPGADGTAIVNSRVSGAWFSLVEDAKTAGVTLSANSSFRSMDHQRDLFAANPNPQLVASPGFSSHQAGVAIDFANMGGVGGSTCDVRGRSDSDAWRWLLANSEKYGFKQYAKEAWHWDALPVANRCGASQP